MHRLIQRPLASALVWLVAVAGQLASGVADAAYSTFSPPAALNTNAATDSGNDVLTRR